MITLFVVEQSAEARTKIIEEINVFLASDINLLSFVPRINIRPLSPEELKFNTAPDIILVGDELVRKEISEISKIRRLFPNASILVKVSEALDSLPIIEQLARLGADDILKPSTEPQEFLKKIILLSRNGSKTKSGKLLLVDGGKGGVGVTSIACGLGEALVDAGKRVCLVDLDFETQDLSRFLQARPFVNENLSLLFTGQRPIVQEAVEHCVVPVWADSDALCVMSPPADGDELYDSRSSCSRTLVSVLEILDSIFDVVIVDSGACRGAMRRSLYRVADDVVFVASNDPATLFSSVDRLAKAASDLSPGSRLVVVENNGSPEGLPSKLLFQELTRASKIDLPSVSVLSIPRSRSGSAWPGSGSTLYSQGGELPALKNLAQTLGLIAEESLKTPFLNRPRKILDKIILRKKTGSEKLIATTFLPELPQQTLPPPEFSDAKDQDDATTLSAKELVKGARLFQ